MFKFYFALKYSSSGAGFMGFLRKAIIIVLIVVVALFALKQTGVIATGNDAVAKIDRTYALNNFSVVPDSQNFDAYEKQIGGVIAITPEDGAAVQSKLEAVRMQKSFQLYISHRQKVDFEEPACGVYSEAGLMKSELKNAIGHAQKALEHSAQVNSERTGNVSSSNFKEFIESELKEMLARSAVLESVC